MPFFSDSGDTALMLDYQRYLRQQTEDRCPAISFDDYCQRRIERLSAARSVVDAVGQSAANIINKAADIRKREAAEAAELLAGAIERRRGANTRAQSGAKRLGRRRKEEKDSEALVIGALVKHHCYQSGGSIEHHEPATTKDLAELAGVGGATVSRFFADKFDRGYKDYVARCNRDAQKSIGLLLTLWQGDINERLANLSPEEGDPDENRPGLRKSKPRPCDD